MTFLNILLNTFQYLYIYDNDNDDDDETLF